MNAQLFRDIPNSDEGLTLYGELLPSRLLLGTALYASPDILRRAAEAAKPAALTVSLRRETAGFRRGPTLLGAGQKSWAPHSPEHRGLHTAREAITTAQMARELFEPTGSSSRSSPMTTRFSPMCSASGGSGAQAGWVQSLPLLHRGPKRCGAAGQCRLSAAHALGSPIGTARGIMNPYALRSLRAYFPDTPLIVDAGLGAPSHAAQAMELGYDGVLLNTAIAKASDPVLMAEAFSQAISAGRLAYRAGLMPPRDMASPSTPVAGLAFRD